MRDNDHGGEIGDVDHFLHFAIAFRLDLAHLQGNQRTQCILCLRKASPHRRTASPRRGAGVVRQIAKACWARVMRFGHLLAGGMYLGDHFVGAGIDRLQQTGVTGLCPLALAEIGQLN